MTPNDLGIFIIFHLVVYILAQLDQNWLRWHHWLHLVVHHYQLVVDQDWFPWHLWQGSGIVLTHDLILEIEMKLCLIPSFSRVLKIKHDCFPRIELGFWRRIRFIDSRVIKWTIWLPIVRYTEFDIDYRLEQKYHFLQPTSKVGCTDGHFARISHGAVKRRQPSARRTPLYVCEPMTHLEGQLRYHRIFRGVGVDHPLWRHV